MAALYYNIIRKTPTVSIKNIYILYTFNKVLEFEIKQNNLNK